MKMSPPDGVNVFIPWELVQWAIMGICSALVTIAGFMWHLAGRVSRLEAYAKSDKEKLAALTEGMQRLETTLNGKIEDETRRLEDRVDRTSDKIDDLRNQLPSRQFIEGQLNNLSQRLDRSLDVRVGRPG